MNFSQGATCNGLLSALSMEDYNLLAPLLLRIPLPLGLRLEDAGAPIERVYFLEDGVASIIATGFAQKQCEIGIFGREGMSGTAAVLDTRESPYGVVMQVAGATGMRIAADDLRQAMSRSSTLSALLFRYIQSTMIQTASLALAASSQTLLQRLARWLLMWHDRVDGENITLKHESISSMLCVRRAGITVALQRLEEAGLVLNRRSCVTLIDRSGLEAVVGYGYGFAESEYERLIGIKLRRDRYRGCGTKTQAASPIGAGSKRQSVS